MALIFMQRTLVKQRVVNISLICLANNARLKNKVGDRKSNLDTHELNVFDRGTLPLAINLIDRTSCLWRP